MNENYPAWLETLKEILKSRSLIQEDVLSQKISDGNLPIEKFSAIHKIESDYIKQRKKYTGHLEGKTAGEIAKQIVYSRSLEAGTLFSTLELIHSITPEAMIQPCSSGQLIDAAVSMLSMWRFHMLTLYRSDGDIYRRTSIDITGRTFENEITSEEFSTFRNASVVSGSILSPGEFSMKTSVIWQPGQGDDLAFRLDDSYIISFTDIDDNNRKITQHEITGLSLAAWTLSEKIKGRRDHLTGLVNRRAWNEFAVSGDPSEGHYIMAAVDRFKEINDIHGHLRGDAVIRIAGKILKNTFGGEDKIYRWSGAEFLVRTSNNNISELADLFRCAVESYDFSTIGIESTVTISAGISRIAGPEIGCKDQAYEREKNAVTRADSGVGAAKRNGRNRVEYIM